jgi:hypothetical protein
VRDALLAVDDLILEGSDCQDPYDGQDPYDESMKLLSTAGDEEPTDGGLNEDSDAISAPQSRTNNGFHSPHMTPAPTATAPHESVAAINSQSATLAPTLDDSGQPPQVAVVDNNQEWEICDIVGKEDVDGVPHYWV